jgi:hypothetical protein
VAKIDENFSHVFLNHRESIPLHLPLSSARVSALSFMFSHLLAQPRAHTPFMFERLVKMVDHGPVLDGRLGSCWLAHARRSAPLVARYTWGS